MRHVFIVNPMAGKRDSVQKLLARIREVYPQGGYEVYATQGMGDARRLALEAIEGGEPVRLYACGGDGTLNEVVNAAAGCPTAAVTNVPVGTGNDFLRIFGPEGRRKFADLAALREGPQAEFDLMDCNGLLGINTVCAGIDARVADDVGRFKRLPGVSGAGAYVLSLANQVGKGLTQPMRVDMGPIHYEGPTTILCVCNGRYYGGGFYPVPEAMPDDGVLDMLLIGRLTGPQFAKYVGKYATGKYRECPPSLVRSYHGEEVTFSSEKELVAVVDGESLRGHAFTVRRSERKISFFYPQGVGYGARTPAPSL